MFLSRHHKKEQRYGPGPSNGYTKGTNKKFWQRNPRTKTVNHDTEIGTVPAATGGLTAAPAHDYRPSHDTAYTGSTVAAPHTGAEAGHKPFHAGYHTAPTGTAAHTAPALTYNNTSTNY
jgi:hypothetical protein